MEDNKDHIGAAVRGEAVAEFNINDMMVVTLTSHGAEIWNNRYADLPLPADLVPKKVTAGYSLKSQLWELMQVFGPHIGLCRPPVFVDMLMAHAKPFAPVSARAADAPSEPSEKFGLLRIADNGKSVTVVSDERFWAGDYSIPDGMYRIVSAVAADVLDSQPTGPEREIERITRQIDKELSELGDLDESKIDTETLALAKQVVASSQPTEPIGYISEDALTELQDPNAPSDSLLTLRHSKSTHRRAEIPVFLSGQASSQPTDGGVRNG